MADLDLDLHLALVLGPDEDPPPMDVLRRAWSVYAGELKGPQKPGKRCWGEWVFEIGEEPPGGEQEQIVRLFELGQLRDGEVEGVRKRALESLQGIQATNDAGALGSITVRPRGVAERMRAERETRAAARRRVLEAVEAALSRA